MVLDHGKTVHFSAGSSQCEHCQQGNARYRYCPSLDKLPGIFIGSDADANSLGRIDHTAATNGNDHIHFFLFAQGNSSPDIFYHRVGLDARIFIHFNPGLF